MSEHEPSIFKLELDAGLRDIAARALAKQLEGKTQLNDAIKSRSTRITDRFLRKTHGSLEHPHRVAIETGVRKLTYLFSDGDQRDQLEVAAATLRLLKLHHRVAEGDIAQTANSFDLYATYACMYKEDVETAHKDVWKELSLAEQFWHLHGIASERLRQDLLPAPRDTQD